MPARSGDQYLQGLRDRPGEVCMGGQQVADVTSHPGLSSGARSVAALYDMQLAPEHLEEMPYRSTRSSQRIGMSFVTPRTQRDLEGRRRMMALWAQSSGGMLGRKPDYLNVILKASTWAVRDSMTPLGSRFEEMGALVIFDNVLVPWQRVFLLGDVDLCNRPFKDTPAQSPT